MLNMTAPAMLVLAALPWLSGCAGTQPTYDASARESLGRIVAKTVIGSRAQTRADSPNTSFMAMYGALGMLVGEAMRKTSELPVYEYRIRLADGREVRVATTYSANQAGECVKVFESPQPSYPRFITHDGCPF